MNTGRRLGAAGVAPSIAKILAVYALISAVYLLYIPHATPVLDDWTYLQRFDQARAGGINGSLSLLCSLINNTLIQQFRTLWASFVPMFALFFVAGFSGWPYFLFAWTAHLLTAVLLWRTVALLTGDQETGFAAGAIYAVFPAANNGLFWPLNTCFFYLQTLGFLWWFYYTWRKLAVEKDYRYTWKDLGFLALVLFSGEQILAALLLLLPVTYFLFGRREDRGRFLRFCAVHGAAALALVLFYALAINREPVLKSLETRYDQVRPWTLYPVNFVLFGSLGFQPESVGWRARWSPEPALIALLAIAAGGFLWGLRLWPARPKSRSPLPLGELLLWSVAGVILTYLPLARLRTFEWRYLCVLSSFLVPAGVALLGLVKRPVRIALTFLAVAYGLSQSFFEMRQCWVPQSRVARAMLDTIATAGPFRSHEILIFSGDPLKIGPAPSFINGASWSMNSVLERYTRAEYIQGARDLAVNERGEPALYRRDSFLPLHREDLDRLRVFVRDSENRFLPKSIIALPVPGRRFQLLPLPAFPAPEQLPAQPVTWEELKKLRFFGEIYLAHWISSHTKSTEL